MIFYIASHLRGFFCDIYLPSQVERSRNSQEKMQYFTKSRTKKCNISQKVVRKNVISFVFFIHLQYEKASRTSVTRLERI
jgi:hypothetical protein